MGVVAKHKLLFFLADEQDRCYYVEGGKVKKSSTPSWVRNPDGWKDVTLKFDTNMKYFSTIRSFSNAIKFVEDGKKIILDRTMKGLGTEEIMYLIILRNEPSGGLNYYKLEYKSRLDFSQFNGDVETLGISMNTLQDDVFAIFQANDSASYSLQCNASNPAAIKVLYDGILMQDKLNYNVLKVDMKLTSGNFWFAVPMTFMNNEGDSVGAIFNGQTYSNFEVVNDYIHDPSNANYLVSFQNPTTVHIKGTFSFTWKTDELPSGGLLILFAKSSQSTPIPNSQYVFTNNSVGSDFDLVPGKTYAILVDFTIDLEANERLFLLMSIADNVARNFTITPLSTNISISFSSKQDPSTAYALRPLDAWQQLVSLITQGKFSGDSNFFQRNNRKVITSGSALRNFQDAVIQINPFDFFKGYSCEYNLGLTVRNGVLFIEPVGDIYNNNRELTNLGEVSQPKLVVAQPYIYTSAEVGYQKQTYNKRNGRYEYNCKHFYKFPIATVQNRLDLVSPIRSDPFGIEFIRTGYPNLDTTDDKGDGEVFNVMISDEVGQTEGEISTALAVTISTLILASPVIKSPYSGTVVYNTNPTISGISQPNMIITIYADGFQDGTTVADVNGNWSYQIATPLESLSNTFNGLHLIEANAQTDPGNISGFSKQLAVIVNTALQSPFLITGPTNNDTLYNNLPIIHGIAPAGSIVTVKLDGAFLTTAVANTSGIWSFQVGVPFSDAAHIITATATGLPDPPAVKITVNKNVAYPLITSLQYGDLIYNNKPLIKGVAIPGTTVSVYLDGGGGALVGSEAGPMGTTVANVNGDWSFQVTSVIDASGFETDYIPDGLHIISTTPTPENVLAAISGYRLMRGSNKGPVPDYDVIRLDDSFIPVGSDPATLPPTLGQFLHPETLYNIEETTPLRMLRAHDNRIKSFLVHQPNGVVSFNGADGNPNLVTKKGLSTFNERADIKATEMAANLMLPWILKFKTKVDATFNDIMTGINNDGYIAMTVKNVPIYCLPLGKMSMKPATDEAQNWELVISGKTPLISLIKIFESGLTLNIAKNMVHFSDLNPLHFVRYNFTPSAEYHFSDVYDDWQKNRFRNYLQVIDNPQRWQHADRIRLQAITNGVGVFQIHMISKVTGMVIDTFPFAPIVGSVVQLPNQLQQVEIDVSGYASGRYWFAVFTDGVYCGIAEEIDLQVDHPDTFLYEYGGSTDKINYYFSTGIMPMIRVPSKFLPWDPDSEVDLYEDENGDNEITRGIPLKSKVLQLGTEKSLIQEWMRLKMNGITLLDNLHIEGSHYTRNKESKMEKEDLGKGVSEFLCKIVVALADNQMGVTFETPGDTSLENHSTVFSLDETAFGNKAGGRITVKANKNA